jgi:hypothetical protein
MLHPAGVITSLRYVFWETIRANSSQGRPRKFVPAGMEEFIPATVELFITYQEGSIGGLLKRVSFGGKKEGKDHELVAAARPDAVTQPVAMVRISHCSSQAVAVWPNMKSTAPTIRFFTYNFYPISTHSLHFNDSGSQNSPDSQYSPEACPGTPPTDKHNTPDSSYAHSAPNSAHSYLHGQTCSQCSDCKTWYSDSTVGPSPLDHHSSHSATPNCM